ncbi:A/G-specific adenine glycosylase [Ammoniphilus oxalaticus]|uniref:Adenine DNA glycosylase n=1 Tax=Ammoniphilus oxalaticus TaxID=66863 RepID=A0A419SDQ5_9BACL|nr:A/G-specific adenine glycosylase [Ammoniphilus oxalaticus]RKD21023.1 A/G-specific adenine glycosylase [Ammoniphilus oxalaticus]
MIRNFDVKTFQDQLLHWFERNLRDLPWRKDKDPYKVWVSEIMLQQTRVDTVIPYFERFVERFPTLDALAAAEEEDVLKMWEGLGYYSRARNLHTGVKEVQATYGGHVPNDPTEIIKIKGIGPYTAGAILSIAYDQPEPAVDGNVMRVLSRLLNIKEDIQKVRTRRQFEEIIREMIAAHNPSYFNQALMELGALICSPRSPSCQQCPVSSHCEAKRLEIQEELPVKGKAKPPRPVDLSVAFIKYNEQILIRQRPDQGLLASLWELPNAEGNQHDLQHHLKQQGLRVLSLMPILEQQHIFSHLIWNMVIFYVEVEQMEEQAGHWVDWGQLDDYTFPASYQRIFFRLTDFFT